MSFDYFTSGGTAGRRTVEPYRLCFKGMNWYLQGWCLTRRDFRVFRLSRIRHLSEEERTFLPRPAPPPLEEDGPAEPPLPMQAVTLRFAPELAFRVYDIFPSEEIAPEPDGGLLVRTRWPEGEWGVSFLLSFGGAVEVLDPPPLRAALRDAAADILKKYEKN